MLSSSSSFIRDKFAEYYEKNGSSIQSPSSIEKREFGFILFREKVMLRHKRFETTDALTSFLRTTVPLHTYYSSAYYESPEKEMDEKGWLGADLIFDIDADHMATPCGKIHDTWTCINCSFIGKGPSPEKCPKCGEQKFSNQTWLCEVCLASAKTELIKLVDVLLKDFGLSQEELKIGFSGNRGYHLHVESEEIRAMDSMARKEVVDYLVGIGLEPHFHGVGLKEEKNLRLPSRLSLDDFGWRGRIAKGTYEFLRTATQEELEKIGLGKKAIKSLIQNRETILENLKEKGEPWGKMRYVGSKGRRRILLCGIEKQSTKIDTVVTTDIHRLIRMNNTLHGKTGLKKVEVPIAKLESFDPLKSAIAFKEGSVAIYVNEAPKFRLGEEDYRHFKRERVELPTAAAMLLLCKGAAKVIT
jgi:DNA primase small subunit